MPPRRKPTQPTMDSLLPIVASILGLAAALFGGRAWLAARDQKQQSRGYAQAQRAQAHAAAREISKLARTDAAIDDRTRNEMLHLKAKLDEELNDPTDRFDELIEEADRMRSEFLQ